MRLTDKMPLELTPSHDRLNNVRLFFNFPAVVAGDFTSKKQYHHLYRNSDVTYWRILDDWDEFLFDKEERLLRGVRFAIMIMSRFCKRFASIMKNSTGIGRWH